MEHFDIRETQKCNKEREVKSYNERMQDLKKIQNEKNKINQKIFDLPYDMINFYTDHY